MEIYTLSGEKFGTISRTGIIEKFESFIWTDRYAAYGDFELVVEATQAMRLLLTLGTFIGFDESDHVMVVNSVNKKEDAEGNRTLTVKGLSVESLFQDRLVYPGGFVGVWAGGDKPEGVVRALVFNCYTTYANRYSLIKYNVDEDASNLIDPLWLSQFENEASSLFTSWPIANYAVPKEVIKVGTLYDAIKKVCDPIDLGFKLTAKYNYNNYLLDFSPYRGKNRTGGYASIPSDLTGEHEPVTFSEDLETLSQTSYLESDENYKNAALVTCGTNYVWAYLTSTVPTGLDRKDMLVDASDLSDSIANASGSFAFDALSQRGYAALSSHNRVRLFDGLADSNSMYKYNVHYFLGDILLFVGEQGDSKPMRVTEHIWSYNAEGPKSYPTLSEAKPIECLYGDGAIHD